MNKLIQKILLIALLAGSWTGLKASHIIGGEITYNCLGNNQYEIVLNVYRDCFYALPDADFDNPAAVGIFNPQGTLIQSVAMPLFMVSDTLDGDVGDPCLFIPDDVCVERAVYKKTVTLFAQPGGYILTYQRCCRNQTINNIADPDQTGATYSVELTPQAMATCNSSPEFDDFAPIFICVGKEIEFNHSATDADGDQLVYSLCTPNSGASFDIPQPVPPSPPPYDSVQYIAPYGLDNLLGFGDPLTIDPNTGQLSGLPTQQGQYVVGICVEEYRNGQLLSTVRRDFQYNVGVCGEIVSSIGAPDAQCDDLTVNFNNLTDTNFANSFEWYFQWPNTSIVSTDFAPTYTYPGVGTYTIALIAEPGASCADTSFHEIFLQNNSLTAAFDVEVFDCETTSILDLTDQSTDFVSPPVSWLWTVVVNGQTQTSTLQNPQFVVPQPAFGTVTLTVTSQNGCVQTLSQNFNTGGNNPGDQIASQVAVCVGSSVALNPNADLSLPFTYAWSPATGLNNPNIPNPIATPNNDITYTVTITGPNNLCSFTKTVFVDVQPFPQLSFDYDFDCNNFVVNFTNTSTNASTYVWNFGDPTTLNDQSTAQNPTYTYPGSGSYTVTLSTGSGDLCQTSTQIGIFIPQNTLNADFSLNTYDCDSQSVLEVIDATTDNVSNPVGWTYVVTLSNGQTFISNDQNPYFQLPLGVSGTVTQTVTAANGCESLEVVKSFTTGGNNPGDALDLNLQVCQGDGVELNPTADPNTGFTYRWEPANSLDDALSVNPTATPGFSTTYSVTISAPNNLCTIERQVFVEVVPQPQLGFTYDFDCNNFTVNFTNTSANASTYIWDFGDPTNPNDQSTATNPTYTYPGSGSYTVTLSTGSTDLCQGTNQISIFIPQNTLNADFALNTYDCDSESVLEVIDATTDNVSNPVSWTYVVTLSNGQTFISNDQSPYFQLPLGVSGTVTQTVTAANGCESLQVVKSFTTGGNNPGDALDLNQQICAGESVELNPTADPNTGFSYQWAPAATLSSATAVNPVASPTSNTIYNVTISAPNNLCTIERQVFVEVVPQPVLDFEYDFDCDNFVVGFTNTSLNSDDFVWNFGDPTNPTAQSTEENPTYTYPGPGDYTVTLSTGPATFCPQMITTQITIPENTLELDFQIDVFDCDDVSIISVKNQSFDSAADIDSYSWTLIVNGVNQTSSDENPNFSVTAPASGVIILTVVSETGCIATIQQPFSAGGNNPADAIDTQREVCFGDALELNPNVNDALGFVYQWEPAASLDDPTSSNPVASPTMTTLYNVTISEPGGLCSSETTVLVEVVPLPQLAFDFEISCDGTTVTFTNQSVNSDGFRWDFGDPTTTDDTSTEENPVYVYPDAGTFTVTLQPGADALCQDVITQEIMIPVRELSAGFSVEYSDCSEETITAQFTNETINSLDNTTGYTWTFETAGGTVTSNDVDPSLMIGSEQTVVVSLTVMTDEGCSNTYTESLLFDFTELNLSTEPVQICLNETEGLNPGGDPSYSYTWEPAGSLSDATAANPIANPTENTTYTVTVSNTNGAAECVIVDSVSVTVPPAIGLQDSDDITTCEESVTLTASTVENAGISFLDENGATVATGEEFTVLVSGTQNFTVQAVDIFGCTELSETITVAGGPVDISSSGDVIICNSEQPTVQITNNDLNDDLSYTWLPDPYIVAGANTANPTIANVPGTTTLTVIAENQFGCADTSSLELVIVDENADLDFTSEVQCNGSTVEFTNTSTNAFGYLWDFGDPNNPNDTSTMENPVYTYDTPGDYTVTLSIVYDVDCVDPDAASVTILEPNIIADYEFEYSGCNEDSLVISFTNTSVNNFNNTTGIEWTIGGDTYTSETVEITVFEDTQLPVSLQIFTANDCDATRSEVLNLDLLDGVAIADSIRLCKGDSVELNPNSFAGYDYQWFPTTGLDDPNSANPMASPSETTVYTATISSFGADTCSIAQSIMVFVPEEIVLTAPGDTITCGPDITLEASATPAGLDYLWTNGNGVPISNGPTAVVGPLLQDSFTLVVTDQFDCQKESTLTVTNRQVDAFLLDSMFLCPTDQFILDQVVNPDTVDMLSYQWTTDPGGIIFGNDDTPTPTVNSEVGFTNFFVIFTNQFGCERTDLTTVQVYDFQPQTPQDENVCTDIPTTINDGADPIRDYVWSPAMFLSDSTAASPEVTTSVDVTYNLNVSQVFPTEICRDSFVVNITVNPLIELEVRSDTLLCDEGGIDLNTETAVGADFIWSLDPNFTETFSTDSDPEVFPEGDVTYYVLATDQFGCMDTSEVTIQAYPIDVSLIETENLCIGFDYEIIVTNNDPLQELTYAWTPEESIVNGENSNAPLVNPEETTTFFVDLENQFGCTAQDSATIVVFDVDSGLDISAEPDTIYFNSGETSQLNVTFDPNFRYEWDNSSSLDNLFVHDPIASPEVTTTYTVVVSNDEECQGSREITVVVLDPNCNEPFIFIPTAFSPNDDGVNDVLFVRSNIIESMSMVVFNRWGQQVFQTDSQDFGWDGIFDGQRLSPDVYGFYITARCFNGQEFTKKGNITLLR